MDLMTHGAGSSGEPGDGPRQQAHGRYYARQHLAVLDSEGLLKRLLRRKLLFAAMFLGTASLVVVAYFMFPKTYKAEALVAVAASDHLLVAPGEETPGMTVGDTADLESQSAILSSPLLLRALMQKPEIRQTLLDECNLLAPPAWKIRLKAMLFLKPTPTCPEQLADTPGVVGSLSQRITVTTTGRSRVLGVTYLSPSASATVTMVNGLVRTYLELLTQEKLKPRDAAISWLRDETGRVSDRLKSSDTQIDSYLHANGVVKGQVASIASEQLTGLAQQIGMAAAEQAAASGRTQQAQAGGDDTSAVLDSRAVGDIKQRLASLTADIAQLSDRYGSAHPGLSELVRQRTGLERLLARETGTVRRGAGADYAAATARLNALRQQFAVLKREVQGDDNAMTEIAALQRNAGMDRDLLVDLTKNLNQLETERRLVVPDAKLISWAEPPRNVFFPKRSIFAAGGLLLATAAATIITLLFDQTDRTVRNLAGLQDVLDLPVIGRIPPVAKVGAGSSQLIRQVQQPSSFQEAIRSLYAECHLVGSRQEGRRKRPLRSFLVTSSESGEGKSFTALALAQFAATAGRTVLLMECDLRRPTIGRSLRLPERPGISDVLNRKIAASATVQALSTPGLSLMLAGKAATNSAELLGSDAMVELLDWAYANYNMVIIDTPPVRALPDARILASLVDCVLYCAWWGHSISDAVVEGVHEIDQAGGNVLGLVLGRVDRARYSLYNTNASRSADLLLEAS